MAAKDEFLLLSTTDVPEGYKLKKVLGMAWGNEVRSKKKENFISSLIKPESEKVVELQKLAMGARKTCIERMIASAKDMGANGIVGVRLTGFTFKGDIVEFIAYGTAVIAEKKR